MSISQVLATKPADVPTKFWNSAVEVGGKYGVDPYLLTAIGKHETGYGTLGLGRQGLSMGYGAYDAGAVYTWQDKPGEFTNQLTAVAKKIKAQFQGTVSLDSLNQFGRLQPGKSLGGMPVGYASDPNWGAKVWGYYQKLNTSGHFNAVKEGISPTKDYTDDAKEEVKTALKGTWFDKVWSMNTLFVVGGTLAILLILVNVAKGNMGGE